MKRLLYILLIITLFGSCSLFKKTTKKNKSEENTTEQVDTSKQDNKNRDRSKEIAKNTPIYNTCSFKCKTSYMGMPVSISVRTTYDSIFWLSATSMGFEAMRIKATRDSIYMIDKLNKENVQWNYNRASVYVGLPLSFEFIQELFIDTTLVKSYNTARFNGTIVKTLAKIDDISFPEQIVIDGKIKGKEQKIKLTITNYKIDVKNEYPFEFPTNYKQVR